MRPQLMVDSWPIGRPIRHAEMCCGFTNRKPAEAIKEFVFLSEFHKICGRKAGPWQGR